MDWNLAIERNIEALKRILATLVAMAGLAGGAVFTSPLRGGRPSSDGRVGVVGGTEPDASRRPPLKGEVKPRTTLPRHLHRAVLRLLRPAESAARRLIIIAARGLVVTLPPPRPSKKPVSVPAATLRSLGIAVVLSPVDIARAAADKRAAAARAARPRSVSLPLLDPLQKPFRPRRVYVPAHAAPRISAPGVTEPHRLPPPPSPDDPVNATRLGLRLAALGRALDDLPRQARRFARWKARRDAAGAQNKNRDAAGAQNKNRDAAGAQNGKPRDRCRVHRTWPLRPGRPPGQRPARNGRRPVHEIHEILKDLHGLAFDALEAPDTS
jgi:hypothetical protein